MDKVYKKDIPTYKDALVDLRREFSHLQTSTDWTKLRVEPLLEHVIRLERLLRAPKFSKETARLRNGVAMFHADLVYLRANLKALKEIISIESGRRGATKDLKRSTRVRSRKSVLGTRPLAAALPQDK